MQLQVFVLHVLWWKNPQEVSACTVKGGFRGRRLLGLALSRAATNRHVRVKVSEIGLLVSKGIHIHLAKVILKA